MNRMQRRTLVAALAIFAMAVPTAGVRAQSSSPSPRPGTPPVGSGGVEILTALPEADVPAVEAYIPGMVRRVKAQWYQVMPRKAQPPTSRQGSLAIEMVLHSDGKVTDMKLTQPSGDVELDKAAWTGITAAAPYPAFTAGVQVREVKLRFTFYYNEKPS